MKKLSVRLDESVARRAAAVAEHQGVSLSTWLNSVAQRALRVDEGLAAVRAWEADHGEPSAELVAWAETVLGGHLGPDHPQSST